jgi:hypothetical protein
MLDPCNGLFDYCHGSRNALCEAAIAHNAWKRLLVENSVKRVQKRQIHSRTLADFALPLFARITINTLSAVRMLNVSCSDTTRASPSCATQFDTVLKRHLD